MDLKQVIESVSKEKNIDHQVLIGALKDGLLSAGRKMYGDCDFETKYNEDSLEMELWRYRVVVKDGMVKDPLKEIPASEALQMDESLMVGDEVGENLPTDQLGRIAAQAAKQSIVQRMVEAEKDKIILDFKDKKGHLVTGQVRRFDKADIVVDLGSCEGLLPMREQIPGEKFKLRDRVNCYVLDVKRTTRGPNVILSRVHPEMLIRLFEQEVAEMAEDIVKIYSAARDPGSRAKISVYSNEPSVDPVGACVGLKGSRVQAIVQELRGEKIDIIPYDRDPARFVCNALAPAEVAKVIVNERLHVMEVVVPDDFLSLAIGKKGQNVRLAAQLTGWKVDIRSESKMRDLNQEHKNTLAQIPELGEMRAEILVNEGYKEILDVARMESKELAKLLRLSTEESEAIIQGAHKIAEKNVTRTPEDDTEDELKALGLSTEFDDFQTLGEGTQPAASAEKLKKEPLQNPDTVDVSKVDRDRLDYWLKLRGMGETSAAVIILAGFEDYSSLVHATATDIAHKTGLPQKFSMRLQAEASKRAEG